MPKLWNDTVDSHRREVREAILSTTAALVEEHGLRAVTMSQIAEQTGIGRATLYKYFSDVEAILLAWHERHVRDHLEHLGMVRDASAPGPARLRAVLEAYALMAHEHPAGELVELLHRGRHIAHAQQHLKQLLRELMAECARLGELRTDIGADELVSYALHALSAAASLPSKAAVRRLVQLVAETLQPRA